MRCEQVTRELATPTGLHAPGEMAAHLASCPACALRAERAARFNRLWEETRPDELPAGSVDLMWAGVDQALDRGPQGSIPMPGRARVGWARAAIGLASAAAILGGIFLANRPATHRVDVAHALPEIEVGLDQTVVIRIGANGPRVQVLDDPSTNPESFPSLADATPHDVMNAMESLAQ